MVGTPDVDKIWLKSYPEGIPATVDEPKHRSLRDMIESSFVEWPDNTAYSCMGKRMSYRELDEQSMKFAGYLQQTLGLTRGERVAIMLPNAATTIHRHSLLRSHPNIIRLALSVMKQ